MKVMTTCPKCQREYDTNTIYGACPYCLRRKLASIPKHIRDADDAARDKAAWDSIVNGK
jgi:DNA-directed RNA polymerase subunit RPC12/RpoP